MTHKEAVAPNTFEISGKQVLEIHNLHLEHPVFQKTQNFVLLMLIELLSVNDVLVYFCRNDIQIKRLVLRIQVKLLKADGADLTCVSVQIVQFLIQEIYKRVLREVWLENYLTTFNGALAAYEWKHLIVLEFVPVSLLQLFF